MRTNKESFFDAVEAIKQKYGDALADNAMLLSRIEELDAKIDRLLEFERMLKLVLDVCVETGLNASSDGAAIEQILAHIRGLASERDQLWLVIDPESAIGDGKQ